ncbi:ABC transporter ATP-binding protein [Methanospirillum sp. J.3.6.1-F.2.7.3]|uniref:Cobalamin import ATP-binding protein BtuD n=1 Tax=Methanospirillum purgamenti TaxID=2834276 RepID=A0A8E7AYE8_9EURY|nr:MULTISPECIES: ABC transporter ATP-binding protein [Methanospirillum]MDX8548905.1 ABC transporter ATP-binding protein [Methanospirillum hungatei]QVV88594.1 ABC transporter ATP-binding protein [Methanospirillum sp. J.3.6.1-F.2.7.3]
MRQDPIIEVRNICISNGKQCILDSVSLSVFKGDFFAIIGPNGAGKTTLLRAMLGLIPYESGEIFLFGKPADKTTRTRIGYVPQHHPFDFSFPITVHEMVMTGRLGKKPGFIKRYSREDYDAASQALSRISAENLKNRPIHDLSGGERQRILIARALAGEPEILILDEPTVFVDTPTEEHFYNLLTALSQEITILMITHDIGVVSRHVNRVACLNRRLYQHESDQISSDMISKTYGCPVDLITHGDIPHRVLEKHGDES